MTVRQRAARSGVNGSGRKAFVRRRVTNARIDAEALVEVAAEAGALAGAEAGAEAAVAAAAAAAQAAAEAAVQESQAATGESAGAVADPANVGEPEEGERIAPNGVPYDHRFVISTERVATDGGVIKLDAWKQGLAKYMQRGKWIARHDLWNDRFNIDETVLGRAVHVGIEDGLPVALVGPSGRALVAYMVYADTPFAQTVKKLYDMGALTDVSVRWDWRTEEVRAPFEEEVLAYGEELQWVCTRADLVEVSAVMMGADDGAQRLRAALEAQLARCRAAGEEEETVSVIERLMAAVDGAAKRGAKRDETAPEGEPKLNGEAPEGRAVDGAAMGDALGALETAAQHLDAWLDAAAVLRQELADAVTAARNLLAADAPDADDLADDEATGESEEPAGEDAAKAAPAPGEEAAPEGTSEGEATGESEEDEDDEEERGAKPSGQMAMTVSVNVSKSLMERLDEMTKELEKLRAQLAGGGAKETAPEGERAGKEKVEKQAGERGAASEDDGDGVVLDVKALLAAFRSRAAKATADDK